MFVVELSCAIRPPPEISYGCQWLITTGTGNSVKVYLPQWRRGYRSVDHRSLRSKAAVRWMIRIPTRGIAGNTIKIDMADPQ